MDGSQLRGLDSLGTEIYDIHEYFLKLTVGQQTPGFWGVTLYFDDMIYMGSSSSHMREFQMNMKKRFEMTYLSKLHYFLGIEV